MAETMHGPLRAQSQMKAMHHTADIHAHHVTSLLGAPVQSDDSRSAAACLYCGRKIITLPKEPLCLCYAFCPAWHYNMGEYTPFKTTQEICFILCTLQGAAHRSLFLQVLPFSVFSKSTNSRLCSLYMVTSETHLSVRIISARLAPR